MEKILIIEDDRATRKALQQLFESEEFSVSVAPDGVRGLEAFRQDRPGFVILDLRMPGMRGQDVCRALRDADPDIPILVLTSATDEVNRVLLLEMGADDYVTKPFSPRELMARVRTVLRRARPAAPPDALELHDVRIDFNQMEAHRGGQVVSLTPQEFKLLRYFSQHPARVISRDELLNEVWGYNSYPSTRTVDAHVLNLRRKLERDPAHPVHFLTVHRAGYKFRP
jgi:DNA-binding response OmpR family regulator